MGGLRVVLGAVCASVGDVDPRARMTHEQVLARLGRAAFVAFMTGAPRRDF
jgi:hypothetical protein